MTGAARAMVAKSSEICMAKLSKGADGHARPEKQSCKIARTLQTIENR